MELVQYLEPAHLCAAPHAMGRQSKTDLNRLLNANATLRALFQSNRMPDIWANLMRILYIFHSRFRRPFAGSLMPAGLTLTSGIRLPAFPCRHASPCDDNSCEWCTCIRWSVQIFCAMIPEASTDAKQLEDALQLASDIFTPCDRAGMAATTNFVRSQLHAPIIPLPDEMCVARPTSGVQYDLTVDTLPEKHALTQTRTVLLTSDFPYVPQEMRSAAVAEPLLAQLINADSAVRSIQALIELDFKYRHSFTTSHFGNAPPPMDMGEPIGTSPLETVCLMCDEEQKRLCSYCHLMQRYIGMAQAYLDPLVFHQRSHELAGWLSDKIRIHSTKERKVQCTDRKAATWVSTDVILEQRPLPVAMPTTSDSARKRRSNMYLDGNNDLQRPVMYGCVSASQLQAIRARAMEASKEHWLSGKGCCSLEQLYALTEGANRITFEQFSTITAPIQKELLTLESFIKLGSLLHRKRGKQISHTS